MSLTVTEAQPIARFRDEFPIFRHSIYLNSCSLGALSARSRKRVVEFLDLWETRGASAWYDVWLAKLDELRAGYARVIGAPAPSTIALHPSISSALTAVGESLDYSARRRIVTTDLDFPTVAYQWLAKAGEGVEVVVVESPDATTIPLEAMARAINDRTALVATSHVFFTSGAIQDIRALSTIAHAHDALLLVDGYQAAGQLPVDVIELDVDFYCAGGLKWLLGGPGIAFLYTRPSLSARLVPRAPGWFAHADPFRFDPATLTLRDDGRRLESGTPALAAVYAQLGGLDLIEELGIGAIRRATMELTEDLITGAREAGLRPKVAETSGERSAIVMVPRADPRADVRRLAERSIVTDFRPGHVRISPYFYNVADDHRAALECLREY
ncbi:MAG: aminotransferase class V-fold PLP-dependent enzyme [Gemmatimonadota bacterium]